LEKLELELQFIAEERENTPKQVETSLIVGSKLILLHFINTSREVTRTYLNQHSLAALQHNLLITLEA
jgi:hypothetical protein